VTAASAPGDPPAAEPARGERPMARPARGERLGAARAQDERPGAGPAPDDRTAGGTALSWAPTAHYRRLASVALLPLLAAVVLGRPGYLVLAAPMVAALALAARRPRYGARANVRLSADRCFEGDQVTITVNAEPDGPADSAGVRLSLPPALAVSGGPGSGGPSSDGPGSGGPGSYETGWRSRPGELAGPVQGGGGPVGAEWQVTAQRWGRWNGRILVTVRSRGGLFAGTAVLGLGEITVFPRPPSLAQLALPAQLRTRIGDHVDRQPGEGVEFAGVRPFVPGDRLRRINWPVTSRRGALHVNQLAAERAAEIVAVIDATTDAGPPGDSSLDRAIRGVAGIARAYTRAGDRVGVITLYGPLRWIAPGIGPRQFYRIVESVLDVRSLYSFVAPDMAWIPPAVLPTGALVIVFSPLLDERAIGAVIDLRERGYPVIVTDVLGTSPAPSAGPTGSGLALRLWRLERRALRYRLESLGIPVVGWPGEPRQEPDSGENASARLDVALGRFARHRVQGSAR
jgi:uncharacterized protein (DUF58 family)